MTKNNLFKSSLISFLTSMLLLLSPINIYGSSFMNQKINISGGGEMEWSEAEFYIKERLERIETDDKYFFGFRTAQYIQNLIDTKVTRTYSESSSEDENVYLVFVCITYNQPYDVYLQYATQFKEDYENHGLSFTVLSHIDYENSREIMKTMMRSNSNPDGMVLIADSGFSVNKNGLPFTNIGIKGEREGGLCKGMSYMTILSYIDSNLLLEENYDKELVNGFLKDYDGSSSLNISKLTEIMSGQAGSYKPDTMALQNYVYEKGKQNYGNGDYLIDMSQIKNTKDYDLLKSLYFYWFYYNVEKEVIQKSELISAGKYEENIPCPASEIDLVIEELKAGRPVAVGISDADGAHSVVGYRIWQDMKDSDIYYLDVYDSNYPKNLGEYEPQIVLYKGDYTADKQALYFYYAPDKKENEKIDTEYRFTKKIHFTDYKGNLLHKNNTMEHWNEDI